MAARPDTGDVRTALLPAISASTDSSFNYRYVLEEAAERLGHPRGVQRMLFDAWDDLYRAGVIKSGSDFAKIDGRWAHLTDHGRATVKGAE